MTGCPETYETEYGKREIKELTTKEYIEFEFNRIINWNIEAHGSDYKYEMSKYDGFLDRMFGVFKAYKLYGIDPISIVEVALSNNKYHVFEKSIIKAGYKFDNTLIVKKETETNTEEILKDEVRLEFCVRDSVIKDWNDGYTSGSPFRVILANENCRNAFGYGNTRTVSYKTFLKLREKTIPVWKKGSKLCYRPALKIIKSNTDKEHVAYMQRCKSRFYELAFTKTGPAYDIFIKKETLTVEAKPEPKKTDDKQANLEEEKRKIEEEKKKIEEEKRKIAEAKKKQEEEEKQRKEANAKLYIIGSGTGFFVSPEGHIVSNDHVVGICRKVASKIDGEIKYFNVIKTDEVNDLGIVKGEYKNPTYLSIKTDGAEYGEDIVAFGYPLADALSTSVKLTRGIVSSLSGPGNNYSEIQIDAAIQPGNSGGPVLNMEGQVVGVASSGLNKLYMLEQSEYIPENVNFAVAAPTLSNFLKANGVKVDTKKFEVNNTKELARIGRPATLQLFCMNTQAVFEELKKTKKHSDVLFEKVIDLR